MKKRNLLGMALATASLLAASLWPGAGPDDGAAHAQDGPLKIGFVYVSPIGDAGWTYQHELARRAVEEKYGDAVETSYVENVPEGADAERVIARLASSGHKLIFTTSFGYMNPTIKVAKRFPNVIFMHATGYKRAENVGTYIARFYEGRYLAGIVAGGMTESNLLGYVAAFPIPEVIRGINAFTRGAQSVNPNIEVRVIWTSSWYDPGKEREAAEALIDQGADVVTQHTDSTAPVQAAEARGKYAIGYHSDMSAYGPNAHLTASTHNWTDYYIDVVRQVREGTWESGNVWGGLKQNMVEMAPYNDAVPQAVRDAVAEARQAIIEGTLHPFQGPVVAQDGMVTIPEGKTMSDDALLRMDYYVKGIVGDLPKSD